MPRFPLSPAIVYNQLMENQNPDAPRKSARWKFVFGLLGIIFLTLAILAGGKFYFFWRGTRAVQELAEALKRAEEEDYQRAMADTYGGKTPQETLRMYIDAVEKGDYELASRYFIIERQERESDYLTLLSDNKKISWFLEKMLKKAFTESSKYQNIDEKHYKIEIESEEPNIYYAIIDFFKYPNNVWKINKISPENF